MNPRLSLRLVCATPLILTLLVSACSQKHYVQVHENSIALYHEFPDAGEVLFASSIDRYQLHPASKVTGDTWEVVVPKEKEFSYFYLVDKTLTRPECQLTILDDFGTRNCLFISEM